MDGHRSSALADRISAAGGGLSASKRERNDGYPVSGRPSGARIHASRATPDVGLMYTFTALGGLAADRAIA